MAELPGKLAEIWSGPVQWDCSLADFSTLGVGGKADALISPSTLAELSSLVRGLSKAGILWQVIGRGSNILVTEKGVSGVVLLIGKDLGRISLVEDVESVLPGESDDSVIVRVEAGCSITAFLNWSIAEGLRGGEFLAGIPGSLGGAIIMNAGAMGQEMSECLVAVEMLTADGAFYLKRVVESQFQYRCWAGAQGDIVACGFLRLTKDTGSMVKKRCCENINQRRESQPKAASAGSFFKNPPGDYAGRLIEVVGLKGVEIGGAQISSLHANFIVNNGSATVADIFSLMALVQNTVKQETGVWLEPEVKILGD